MASKTQRARKIINRGDFIIPSPEQVEAARTPKGGWSAATLASWGIPWPPKNGWRKDLEIRYKMKGQNLPAKERRIELTVSNVDDLRSAHNKIEGHLTNGGFVEIILHPIIRCVEKPSEHPAS